MRRYELIAPCHFGMEAVLKKEIIELGYDVSEVADGRVSFLGDEEALCRANVFLRTAERVLIKIGRFTAETYEELFQGTRALPWEEYIPKDGKFWVTKAASVKSRLFSPSDIQSIMKKAMVERMKAHYGLEHFPEEGERFPVRVFLLKDEVTVGLDTTGESLHKRGYRRLTAKAPIAENLAAAMILLTPWRGDRILVDPFCGSGTIPIEAAMMAANMAPGMKRSFTAQSWPHIAEKSVWQDTLEEARELVDLSVETDIQGYDADDAMVSIARENARLAGVEKLIHFQRREAAQLSHPKKYGFIITNPPYGERLEEKEALPALYQTIGERFRGLDDWSMYLITSYEQAERDIGRKADRNRKIYNGMMKTYYYQFLGPKPPDGEAGMKSKLDHNPGMKRPDGHPRYESQSVHSKLDWRGWMTLALWVVLCSGCMAVMLWWTAGKSIVIADTAPGEQEGVQDNGEEAVERYRLTLEAAEGKPGHFTIPIAPAVRAEQISMENRYAQRQLWIYIQGAQAVDYRDYVIAGDTAPLVGGWAQQQEDMVILKLQMNAIQEYSSVMEENQLYVEYKAPEECFDRIVVIDPQCGGEDSGLEVRSGETGSSQAGNYHVRSSEAGKPEDGGAETGSSENERLKVSELCEKEINLQIARAVRQLLEGSEIKIYLTRQEDVEISPEDRALLVREVNADLYVGIGVGGDEEDPEQFGTETWYNGDYFIPGFGNLQLADLLERQVTEAVSGRANGLMETQDPVLQRLTIPGALVKAGYLTHEREGALLGQQGYVQKVAEGIVEALRQAFEELEAAQ